MIKGCDTNEVVDQDHKQLVLDYIRKVSHFKCEYCPFSTNIKSSVNRHINRVHKKNNTIKNHVCPECGFSTSTNTNLKVHLLTIHRIGDKKYECQQCPYVAAYESRMKRHVKEMHDKNENLVCDVCGKAYSGRQRQSNLKRHRELVHKMWEA